MFLMYVDESGDSGQISSGSPTDYFILSAIVIHELRWRDVLESLTEFRRYLSKTRGLKLREEIHSADFINKPGDLVRIPKNDRLDILKKCMDWLNSQPYVNVMSVAVDKNGKQNDIFEQAWNALLTRFDNSISHNNFSGPHNPDERGVVLSDNTEGTKLRALMRKMRHYNPIPNNSSFSGGYRNIKLNLVIEDPVFRDSKHSFLHQMTDVLAYCVRQKFEPNSYMKRKGGHNFWKRVSDVSVLVISPSNNGILEL